MRASKHTIQCFKRNLYDESGKHSMNKMGLERSILHTYIIVKPVSALWCCGRGADLSVDIKMALCYPFAYPLVVALTHFSTVYVIDKYKTDERWENICLPTTLLQGHCLVGRAHKWSPVCTNKTFWGSSSQYPGTAGILTKLHFVKMLQKLWKK